MQLLENAEVRCNVGSENGAWLPLPVITKAEAVGFDKGDVDSAKIELTRRNAQHNYRNILPNLELTPQMSGNRVWRYHDVHTYTYTCTCTHTHRR